MSPGRGGCQNSHVCFAGKPRISERLLILLVDPDVMDPHER